MMESSPQHASSARAPPLESRHLQHHSSHSKSSQISPRPTRFGMKPKGASNLIGLSGFIDDGSGNVAWNDAVLADKEQTKQAEVLRSMEKGIARKQYETDLKSQMKHKERRKRSDRKTTILFDQQRIGQDQYDVHEMCKVMWNRKQAERLRTDHNLQQSLAWDVEKREEVKRRAVNSAEEQPWHFSEEVKEKAHVRDMKKLCREDAVVHIDKFKVKKNQETQQRKAEEQLDMKHVAEAKELYAKTKEARDQQWKARQDKLTGKAERVTSAVEGVERNLSVTRRRELTPSHFTPAMFTPHTQSEAQLARGWKISQMEKQRQNAAELDAMLEIKKTKEAEARKYREDRQRDISQAINAMQETAQNNKLKEKLLQRTWKQDLRTQAESDALRHLTSGATGFTDEQVKPHRPPLGAGYLPSSPRSRRSNE